MRREKSNVAPKYAVYRAYASDTSGTNFSTTQSDTLPFMAEYLSEYVIEPSKVNAALFTGKWVRYIPSILGLLPETVLVSVDSAGDNPDLPITVTTSLNIGIEDDIANWTITVEDETDCTATVVIKNVRIDTLTADTGTLTVVANKTGYDEITKTLTIKKVYDGADGSNGTNGSDGADSVNIIVTPSTIHIPCNWAGLEPVYTNALSTMIVTVGNTDDTTNWAFAVQSVSNVTAAIQNDDEVAVSAITADEGSITVRASRSGFSNIDVLIPVKKIYAGENGTTDDYDDVTIGKDGLGDLYVKDGGIDTDQLATGAVEEAKIGTGAVTEAKIGTGAVTPVKLSMMKYLYVLWQTSTNNPSFECVGLALTSFSIVRVTTGTYRMSANELHELSVAIVMDMIVITSGSIVGYIEYEKDPNTVDYPSSILIKTYNASMVLTDGIMSKGVSVLIAHIYV